MHGETTTRPVPDENPELVVLSGHTAQVLAVALSPDGTLLATSGSDGLVLLWNAATGETLRIWKCSDIYWLAFTPDGLLTVASVPGVHLFNPKTGAWAGSFPYLSGPLAFDGAGRLAAMEDERLVLCDWPSGAVIRRTPAEAVELSMVPPLVAVSPDGATGAVYDDSERRLLGWCLADGAQFLRRRVPSTYPARRRNPQPAACHSAVDVEQLALSPGGRWLAVGGNYVLWLCDTRTGRRTRILQYGRQGTRSLAFSPDGTRLAAGFTDGEVRVCAIPSGREIASVQAHASWVTAVAFSADGEHLVTAGDDKRVRIWRLGESAVEGTLFPCLGIEAAGLAYSPEGTRVAVSYRDGTLRLWNAGTGVLEHLFETGCPGGAPPIIKQDDNQEAVGVADRRACWDCQTGASLRTGGEPQSEAGARSTRACEATSPDGRIRAVGGATDGTIELRATGSGDLLRTLPGSDDPDCIVSLVFSPDGQTLAAGYGGFRVRLWDVDTGALRQPLRPPADEIGVLAFSPDGTLLAIGGDYDPVVLLCNLERERQPVRVVLRREEYAEAEGRGLYRGVPPEQIPGEEVSLEGHTDAARGACFAPDGRTVATVAGDAALKIWETATGRLIATCTPLPSVNGSGEMERVTYTPDGFYLGSDGAHSFLRWRSGDDLLLVDAVAEDRHSPARVAAELRLE